VGFRFYRRVHLFPGVSVNLSRSGPSLSVGVRGAHVTVGPGRITKTVGLPGTGIFYTSRHGTHTGIHSAVAPAVQTPTDRRTAFTVGLFVLAVLVVLVGLVVVLLLRV
jgi:hypothetical protein